MPPWVWVWVRVRVRVSVSLFGKKTTTGFRPKPEVASLLLQPLEAFDLDLLSSTHWWFRGQMFAK